MSSMCSATCEKRSLTSIPLSPYFLKAKGERKPAPVLRSVRRFSIGSSLPWNSVSFGFGSNVSTCEGPPFMNR